MKKFRKRGFCREAMKKRVSVTSAPVLILFLLVAFIVLMFFILLFNFSFSFSFSKDSLFLPQTSLYSKWMALFHAFTILVFTVHHGNRGQTEEEFDLYFSSYLGSFWYNPETGKEKDEEFVGFFVDYVSSEDDFDDEFHGCDGYEEDDDDDDDNGREDDYGFDSEEEEEEPDYELKRKGEEFIAMMHSKWKEELICDRHLLTAGMINCGYMEEYP